MKYEGQIIMVLVSSSLVLQLLVHVLAPLRKYSTRRTTLGFISVIFSLKHQIPAFALILICSRAIFFGHHRNHPNGGRRHEPPLLAWAARMLLLLLGHGHERERPLSLEPDQIAKESHVIILEFVIFASIFFISFLLLFESCNLETLSITLCTFLLTCSRTFSKLRHLWGRGDQIKQGISVSQWQSPIPPPLETNQVGPTRTQISRGRLLSNPYTPAHVHFPQVYPNVPEFQAINLEVSRHSSLQHRGLEGDLTPLEPQEIDVIAPPLEAQEEDVVDSAAAAGSSSSRLRQSPENIAFKLVKADLKPMYDKFYSWPVISSRFELLIKNLLLSMDFSLPIFNTTTTFFTSTIFIAILSPYLTSIIQLSVFLLPIIAKVLPYTGLLSLDFHDFLMLEIKGINILIAFVTYYSYNYNIEKNDENLWSKTIPQFNLLEYGLQKTSKLSVFVRHILSWWPSTTKEKCKDKLGKFIFRELNKMIGDTNVVEATTKKIIVEEGQWVLKQGNYTDLVNSKASFEERALTWHVATSIMYYDTIVQGIEDDDDNNNNNRKRNRNRNKSKLLSDYMGYLLVVHPLIFYKHKGCILQTSIKMWKNINDITRVSLGEWMQQLRRTRPDELTSSVIHGACDLVNKLELTFKDGNERWKVIVRVWVEMLAYASWRCKPMNHIHGLSQGGELATIIWLGMRHLGFPDTFYQSLPKKSNDLKLGILSKKEFVVDKL